MRLHKIRAKKRPSPVSQSVMPYRVMHSIEDLILSDEHRMKVLKIVAALNLPDYFVAAGFVRNLVWDYLHGFEQTPLNDIDVIYFDNSGSISPDSVETKLKALISEVNWEVKNQALMHNRNGDNPYHNSADAMRFWPEKETAVGVRLDDTGGIVLVSPFGIDSLLSGCITFNPNRSKQVFEQRIKSKGWLEKWPQLRVVA